MAEVVPLFGEQETAEQMLEKLRTAYPNAQDAIIILFEPTGGVHMQYSARRTDLAMAGARLTYLAGKGDGG